MFGRKKQTTVAVLGDGTAKLETTVEQTLPIDRPAGAISAQAAWEAARSVAVRFGDDARLFLVLSADVDNHGFADQWEFHFLFPTKHAEGVLTVNAGPAGEKGRPSLHVALNPFPAPGSPEAVMAVGGGTYMSLVIEQKWQERLERIVGLPTEFHDSTEAVSTMNGLGHRLFGEGVMRMKARTLPDGQSVWEALTGFNVVHVPFGR